MSYTEIYAFGKNGKVVDSRDIRNAWRGAMAVWRILEKKYLPSLQKPIWAGINDKEDYWSRTSDFTGHGLKEIWSLADDKRLIKNEKIVLLSTFDKVLIKKENIKIVIKAFKAFNENTNLNEQAEAIEELLKSNKIIAIGFNQTSVNGDTWENYNYNEKKEESSSYNCLKQKDHWWLFDDISLRV
jgi:hypothetical protein